MPVRTTDDDWPSPRFHRPGYTLIEVMGAMAIIAVLAGILFPVLARAKSQAKEASCLNNLSQIGKAIGIYQADSAGVYPYAVNIEDKLDPSLWKAWPKFEAQIPHMPMFSDLMLPYVGSKETFHCPKDSGLLYLDQSNGFKIDAFPTLYQRYGDSYFYMVEASFYHWTDSTIPAPANLRLAWDATGAWHGSGNLDASDVEDTDREKSVEALFRFNAVFADFHVKSISMAQFDTAPWVPYIGTE